MLEMRIEGKEGKLNRRNLKEKDGQVDSFNQSFIECV